MSLRRGGRFTRFLQAVVGDEHAIVTLKWFRGGEMIAGQLAKGRRVLVSGEVRRYRFSKELIHPELEFLAGQTPVAEAPRATTADVGGPRPRHPRLRRRRRPRSDRPGLLGAGGR